MSAVVARNILDGVLYVDKLRFPDVAVNVPASIAPESRGVQAPGLGAYDALSICGHVKKQRSRGIGWSRVRLRLAATSRMPRRVSPQLPDQQA